MIRSSAPGSGRTWLAWLVGALCIAAWIALFENLGQWVHGYGPWTFFEMACVAALLAVAPAVAWRLPPSRGHRTVLALSAVALLVLGGQLAKDAADVTTNPRQHWTGTDIAFNTFFAEEAFGHGGNPYVKKCQVGHPIEEFTHVTRDENGFRLYGVPYTFGYPYFPAMFLSYMPIHSAEAGLHSIRHSNAIILALTLIGALWLTRRLVPGRAGPIAALFAGIAFLGIPDLLVRDFFLLGETDGVIALYVVAAFLAWTYDLPVAAGVLLGTAQACKLLPGPLLVVPLALSAAGTPAFRQLLMAFAVTALAFIVPFVLLSPAHFLSSTILFYLSAHGGGDDTSLWWSVPSALRPFFSGAGLILIVLMLVRCLRRRDTLLIVQVTFLAYFTFVAFAPLTHMNYVWSIYPLGCVALAALFGRSLPQEAAAA